MSFGRFPNSTCSLAGCDAEPVGGFYCPSHTVNPADYGVTAKREIPLYGTWIMMMYRCYNPAGSPYKHYGGRGISVCPRWRESFDAFYRDMHPRPGLEYSIDRQDNDGNYEPGNCRWATRQEQNRNRNRRPPQNRKQETEL